MTFANCGFLNRMTAPEDSIRHWGSVQTGLRESKPLEQRIRFRKYDIHDPSRVPPNKQLQRTVIDKVPRHLRRRAAAELRR
jgi:hypothetical protein